MTFVPCFLFVLLGAPYVERLRHNTHSDGRPDRHHRRGRRGDREPGAFFAVHTLFDRTRHVTAGPFDFQAPVWSSIQLDAVAVTVLGCYLIFGRGWSVLRTLGACALSGIAITVAVSIGS